MFETFLSELESLLADHDDAAPSTQLSLPPVLPGIVVVYFGARAGARPAARLAALGWQQQHW